MSIVLPAMLCSMGWCKAVGNHTGCSVFAYMLCYIIQPSHHIGDPCKRVVQKKVPWLIFSAPSFLAHETSFKIMTHGSFFLPVVCLCTPHSAHTTSSFVATREILLSGCQRLESIHHQSAMLPHSLYLSWVIYNDELSCPCRLATFVCFTFSCCLDPCAYLLVDQGSFFDAY